MVVPYPQAYGGTLPDEVEAPAEPKEEAGGVMAFDFGVSPEEAMRAYQEAEAQQQEQAEEEDFKQPALQ